MGRVQDMCTHARVSGTEDDKGIAVMCNRDRRQVRVETLIAGVRLCVADMAFPMFSRVALLQLRVREGEPWACMRRSPQRHALALTAGLSFL